MNKEEIIEDKVTKSMNDIIREVSEEEGIPFDVLKRQVKDLIGSQKKLDDKQKRKKKIKRLQAKKSRKKNRKK